MTVEIYPVDPDCPRVAAVRAFVQDPIQRDGDDRPVREIMEEFVAHHAAVCPRCLRYNAAKGAIDG